MSHPIDPTQKAEMTQPPQGPSDSDGDGRPDDPGSSGHPRQPPSHQAPTPPGPYGPPPGQQGPPPAYPGQPPGSYGPAGGQPPGPYGPPGAYGPPPNQQLPPGQYPGPNDTQRLPPFYPSQGQGNGYGGPGPMPPNAGGTPPSGNRKSLFVVLGILGVLLVIAGGLGVYAITNSGGEAEGGASAGAGAPTEVSPTDDLPTDDLPTDGLPSDLLTDLPTDLTELPELPTEGGPSEKQYIEVATAFIEAARDGDCGAARALANGAFNDTVADENLCEGTTQAALKDDDLDDFELEVFGTYGALVSFDDGQTNVSLVSQPSGDPQVQYFIAF